MCEHQDIVRVISAVPGQDTEGSGIACLLKKRWPALVVGLSLLVGFLTLSNRVWSAVQIGEDEFFEVNKAMLWARGYTLYTKIWNDQPPLYTIILGSVVRVLGPSIAAVRLIAVLFGASLFVSCWLLVKYRSGNMAAAVAALVILTAPDVFRLSISAMLEIPAMTLALWAVWAIFQWNGVNGRLWLVLSGVMMAVGLQTKLVAGVFVPAAVLEIGLLSAKPLRSFRLKQTAINAAIWGGTTLAAFVALGWVFGSGYREAWQSHFSAGIRLGADEQHLEFSFRALLDNPDGVIGCAIGTLVAIWQRDWRRISFPSVLLITLIVFHSSYSPYWPFYSVHFAIPIAWLAGYAVASLVRSGSQWVRYLGTVRCALAVSELTVACGLVCAIAINGSERLRQQVAGLRMAPNVHEHPMIAAMKRYASQTKWVYDTGTMYPFDAGLLVVPELAVPSRKRFWSGQLSGSKLLEIVESYKPEQLVLRADFDRDPKWKRFVNAGYKLVLQDHGRCLYVLKGMAAQ